MKMQATPVRQILKVFFYQPDNIYLTLNIVVSLDMHVSHG